MKNVKIVKNADMNLEVQGVVPAFSSLGHIPRSRIAGAWGNSMVIIFSFFEELSYCFPQTLNLITHLGIVTRNKHLLKTSPVSSKKDLRQAFVKALTAQSQGRKRLN